MADEREDGTRVEPARSIAFGETAPTELDQAELRRRQVREAGKRRRARWKEAPIPWAFPNDPPRGLGDRPGTGRHAVVERGDEDG